MELCVLPKRAYEIVCALTKRAYGVVLKRVPIYW